jgi:hypothetical protein
LPKKSPATYEPQQRNLAMLCARKGLLAIPQQLVEKRRMHSPLYELLVYGIGLDGGFVVATVPMMLDWKYDKVFIAIGFTMATVGTALFLLDLPWK